MSEKHKIKLPFLLYQILANGKPAWYVRVNGKRERIRSAVGSPEFMADYEKALAALRARTARPDSRHPQPNGVATGTLAWLGKCYFNSDPFAQLSPVHARNRRAILEACFAEPLMPGEPLRTGQIPLARLEPGHIRMLRDRKKGAPAAGNARRKYLSAMFNWAVEEGLMKSNPARDVKPTRYDKEAFHTWTVDEVRRFEARWPVGTRERLALAMLLYLGPRKGDFVKFGPQHVRDGVLTYTPGKTKRKTGRRVEVPILPVLRDVIAASPTGHLAFLMTGQGRPFTANGFGNFFRDACDKAGLPHCSSHGLRRAGATLAADFGATVPQLMAMFGWTSPKQAIEYVEAANRRRLAREAMPLIARAMESGENG